MIKFHIARKAYERFITYKKTVTNHNPLNNIHAKNNTFTVLLINISIFNFFHQLFLENPAEEESCHCIMEARQC